MLRGLFIQSPDQLPRRWRLNGILLVVVCLAFTALMWWLLTATNAELAQERLRAQTDKTVNVLENNIETYADVLYSTRALFFVDPSISRDEWDVYTKTQNTIERYSGIQNVTYIQRAPASQLGAIENELNDNRRKGEPEVVIRDRTPTLAVVTYVTNPDTISIVGVNANYREVYQGALKEAESTGVIAASPVYVSRAPGREGQNDFFIALATYRTIPSASISEPARANLASGYVTAAVNVDSLVDMALKLVDAPESLHMTITDPADKTFYDNDKDEEFHFDGVERTVTMNVGGQVWYLHFHAPANFQLTLREQVAPWLFLIGGLAFTVVALILYLERIGLHLRVIRTRPPESE